MRKLCSFLRFFICLIVVGHSAQSAPAQLRPRPPSPIYDRHINDIVIWLNLSPEQEHAVRLQRDQYETDWTQAHRADEQINEYRQLRETHQNAVAALAAGSVEHREADSMLKMHRIVDVWRTEIERYDRMFFDQIEAMLADEQKRHMDRVRLWRERQTLRPSAAIITLPEVLRIDLMKLVRKESDQEIQHNIPQTRKHMIVSRSEWRELEAAINAYEHAFVDALNRLARAERAVVPDHYRMTDMTILRFNRWQAAHNAGETVDFSSFESDVANQIELISRRIRQRVHTSALEVERINRFGLQLFMQHLPDDKAAQLQRIYLEEAYPDVYPDPASAEKLYDAALTIESLDENQRTGIVTLREEYRRRHETLSQKMAEADRAQREALMIHRPNHGNELRRNSYIKLADLGWEREQLNAAQMNTLELVLTADQFAQLPAWDFEAKPPPRPWWRHARAWVSADHPIHHVPHIAR